jgi:polysaccharide pyruvyl transferase WcaK-like protein
MSALVAGGGSLLHDRHPGNLELWLRLVRLYRRLGVKVFFYGVGLGPFRGGKQSHELVKRILDLALGASFRDPASADLAESLLPGRGFERAADPVAGLLPLRSRPARNLEASAPLCVGFNLSRWAAVSDQEVIDFGAQLASVWLHAVRGTLRFLPMSGSDLPLAAAIGARLPVQSASRFQIAPHEIEDLDRHLGLYEDLDLVITSRLHTAVVSAAANLPVAGIDTDPKLPAFLNEAGYGDYVVTAPAGAGDAAAAARSALSHGRSLIEGWPNLQRRCRERMQKLALAERNNVNGLRRALGK